MPGLVFVVSSPDGSEVRALGNTAFEGGVPMRRDTIFRISSLSKPITAAAAMLLVDDGVLHLDKPVDGLLPELSDRVVLKAIDSPIDDTGPAARPITPRDLLTFTFGFGAVFAASGAYPIQSAVVALKLGSGAPSPATPPAPDEWIRRLGSLPLMYQPGERWLYNTGADVLGVLIARASGLPFDRFLQERLFTPLGMRDTGFFVPAAQLHRLATSYLTHYQTGAPSVYDLPDGGQWSRPPAFPSGAGGMVSTVEDYLQFAHMLRNGGEHSGRRLLSSRSVAEMTSDQLTPAQKAISGLVGGYFNDHGWGYGLSVVTGSDPAGGPGTYGWDGGLGTVWRTDPGTGTISLLFTQVAWPSASPPPICVDFGQAVAASG